METYNDIRIEKILSYIVQIIEATFPHIVASFYRQKYDTAIQNRLKGTKKQHLDIFKVPDLWRIPILKMVGALNNRLLKPFGYKLEVDVWGFRETRDFFYVELQHILELRRKNGDR